MQVRNSYYWFKEAISPENCQKIIDMGEKQIQEIKKSGGSTEATTFGDNHKQAFEKEGREAISQKDETVEDVKKRIGDKENIEQTRYIRDSEVAMV